MELVTLLAKKLYTDNTLLSFSCAAIQMIRESPHDLLYACRQ